jgi:shikimate kinase
LDTYIEKKAELSISAIFEMKGEIKFGGDEALWNY